MLEHSQFAKLAPEQFDTLFAELCEDDELKDALSPLCLVDSLPDAIHWRRYLSASPDEEAGFQKLAQGVASCFDHQSQPATDCRWVRVMTLMAQEKMVFQEHMQERVEEIIHYPDYGDMRSVRPHIRAMEMITRRSAKGEEHEPGYSEAFWAECFAKTPCIPWFPDERVERKKHAEFFESVAKLYDDLSRHFIATIQTTAIDARHDGSFGLVFYALQLLIFSLKTLEGSDDRGTPHSTLSS